MRKYAFWTITTKSSITLRWRLVPACSRAYKLGSENIIFPRMGFGLPPILTYRAEVVVANTFPLDTIEASIFLLEYSALFVVT